MTVTVTKPKINIRDELNSLRIDRSKPVFSGDAIINGVTVGKGPSTKPTNTVLGAFANYAAISGEYNTSIGYNAGFSNTTSNQNTFLGAWSGFKNSTGSYNTLLGMNAGYYSTTASANTFIGCRNDGAGAGQEITTGSNNVIIGGFTGNSWGTDLRTQNNYTVISNGGGVPNAVINTTEWKMVSGGSSGTPYFSLLSNGGGNNSGYNGVLIGSNMVSLSGQSNTALPSWYIDIGGRAGDGSTFHVSQNDVFRIARVPAGGNIYANSSKHFFSVNSNGTIISNGVARASYSGQKSGSTQVKLRVWFSNYSSGILKFYYTHTNDLDTGSFIEVFVANNYGTLRTQAIASKTTNSAITLSTTTVNGSLGGDGYYEITMSAGNGSPGFYGVVVEGVNSYVDYPGSGNAFYFTLA